MDATLDSLTAEQASKAFGPGVSTIAAHVIHTAYYLELANASLRGEERDADWSGSWRVQSLDEPGWTEAKENLASQKEQFLEFVGSVELADNEERLTYVLANLGHVAYHLGAIRQLFGGLKVKG